MSDYSIPCGARGYYEIGIYHPKTEHNVGTLWRSAYQLGAAGIFVIGPRFPAGQASDTYRSWRHLPFRQYDTFELFQATRPYDAPLVAVEIGGKPLASFAHPPRALYLLGAEDHGLPPLVLSHCQAVVQIETIRVPSCNVAVAGSIVMYHRLIGKMAL